MAGPLMDAQSATAFNGVAADSRSLDRLRQLAERDPAKAVKAVATQFEALFMQMVLKSMRAASPKSGMFDSQDEQTYQGMLDEQLAQKIASGGTGLGEVIARQLSRNLPQALDAKGGQAQRAPAPAQAAQAANPAGAAAWAPAIAPERARSAARSPAGVLQNIRAAAAVRKGK